MVTMVSWWPGSRARARGQDCAGPGSNPRRGLLRARARVRTPPRCRGRARRRGAAVGVIGVRRPPINRGNFNPLKLYLTLRMGNTYKRGPKPSNLP